MKKRAFTILEIVIIRIIVGILATLGIPFFQNIIEKSNADVCATNLKAFQKAVEIYIRENDEVPATLAALPQEDVNKAFAELMQEKGAWKRRLAFFIRDVQEYGLLYAASEYFPRLRCPKDHTPENISYGLMAGIPGLTASAYAALPANTPIIADADTGNLTASVMAFRHHRWQGGNKVRWAIAVTKNGYTGCFDAMAGTLDPACFGWPELPSDCPPEPQGSGGTGGHHSGSDD